MSADLRKGQRVLVSYGRAQVFNAVGQFAVSGYVRRRLPRRPDWFEIELGWDLESQAQMLVTAHREAITLNGYVS